MESVIEYLESLPLTILGAAAAIVVAFVLIVIVALVKRRNFTKRVRLFLENPAHQNPEEFFSATELLRRSRQLERLADRDDERVVSELQLDSLWTERLYEKEQAADFRRVLKYGTTRGLFACFLTALRNRRLAKALRDYLAEHSDFLVLRRLAVSGRGEEFNGEKAREFLADRIDEVREMTGDPEWPSRYFAVKILLHDSDERSDRALREAFADPHPLVRKTVAAAYTSPDREQLYATLEGLFLHDPVFEVRRAARARIREHFADLYSLQAAELGSEEALHVIGLLDPENSDDVNAATELLAGKDLELRLTAARFLATSGTLERLFLRVDFADREELDRVRSLLRNAIEVHVDSFLSAAVANPTPASLLVAAELLAEHGPPELIVEIAERVFRLQQDTTDHYEEIYAATIRAVRERGPEDAHRLLAREIVRRRNSPRILKMALEGVPRGQDTVYRSPLRDALLDPDFPERAALRTAFLQLDTPFVLANCVDIITAGREENPHRVRIDALLALGELKLPFTLQDILEHLPILPVDVAREFTRTLHEFQPKELEHKVRLLLDSVDGNIRAAVIAALPATGKKTFLPEIKKALDDADPDVRIAATWSLVDYEETRAVNQAAAMLRDPVERVRQNVAKALAVGGGKSALDSLRSAIADENEVDIVKQAVIEGLSSSTQPEAVDILVDIVGSESSLRDDAQRSLSGKIDPGSIKRLVEHFKDAEPVLRDRITSVFRMMGESGEAAIGEVLEDDIASLRPYLAEILETTGYVESRIRLLSHRDPRIRREAARFLSRVATEAAFRGIVLAARDPDTEVRVQVTKALERLATDDGKEILQALEADPDRRIRKYTHWALERLEAKSL